MTLPVAPRPASLYIECTPTVRFDHGTGIPRVVRNVVQHAIRIGRERGLEVRPIAFTNGAFFEARLTAEGNLVTLQAENIMQASWRRRVREGYRAVVNGTGRILPPGRARKWWVAPGSDQGLTRTLRMVLGRNIAAVAEPPLAPILSPDAVKFSPGDTVLAAEPFLDREYIAAMLALRRKGVRLACIVYDLIPIRHPEYVVRGFSGRLPKLGRPARRGLQSDYRDIGARQRRRQCVSRGSWQCSTSGQSARLVVSSWP